MIDRARLAVGHDNGPADQLLLGSMQFGEDAHSALVAGARAAHARENSADESGVEIRPMVSAPLNRAGGPGYLRSRRVTFQLCTAQDISTWLQQ
jgi:hypothetical protein